MSLPELQSEPLGPATLLSVGASSITAGPLTCTLSGVSGKTTYAQGFEVYGCGASVAVGIIVTLTGSANILSWGMGIPSGATVDIGENRLDIEFPTPIPASATNTAIVLNVPSFGNGNVVATAVLYGFQQ
jgi:hypothetical protein